MKQETIKIHNWPNILFWLGFLILFIYSFQAIIDYERIANPDRQKVFIRILTALTKPNLFEGETSRQVAVTMWETIEIVFLATTIGAVLAMPITYFMTRSSSLWGRGFKIILQPVFSAIRAVHPLIIISPIIGLTGIGPTSGVLTLTIFSTAVLNGKFSEYAQQHETLKWPLLIKAHFPGLSFKYLPVSILIASVLGFVGGGGIGFLFK